MQRMTVRRLLVGAVACAGITTALCVPLVRSAARPAAAPSAAPVAHNTVEPAAPGPSPAAPSPTSVAPITPGGGAGDGAPSMPTPAVRTPTRAGTRPEIGTPVVTRTTEPSIPSAEPSSPAPFEPAPVPPATTAATPSPTAAPSLDLRHAPTVVVDDINDVCNTDRTSFAATWTPVRGAVDYVVSVSGTGLGSTVQTAQTTYLFPCPVSEGQITFTVVGRDGAGSESAPGMTKTAYAGPLGGAPVQVAFTTP